MKLRFSDSSGSALVEVALAAPLFLLLLTGAFELGRVAHFAIEVQNAARAGASYGSTNSGNSAATNSIIQEAKNDAPDLGSLAVTPGTGCVCEALATGSTPTYSPSSGTVACTDPTIVACSGTSGTTTYRVVSYVTVSTQATINPIFNVTSLPGSYTIHGYSEMRVLPN
ncbi:TadE/TadG family type IV pilus assembly protein [Telmatobacter sp. DSM 110680]|uniref:TadE/TadG family type IV pilus assembly protein n=1 Tax=Telmatobacter sp. DSM 110680 TaxID=3036704 RepID=A0AAU7DI98_9BACT